MTEPVFLFLRHGESRANAGLATDDAASIPLTARGEDQARSLSRHFPNQPRLVISSPYLRAMHTASLALSDYPGVKIDIWPIQEFTYLAADRCAGTNMADRAGWVLDYWRRSDPDYCDGPGAENFRQLAVRVRETAHRLENTKKEEAPVALFGHMLFMNAFRLMANAPQQRVDGYFMRETADKMREMSIPNAKGFVARFVGGAWHFEDRGLKG